ncbi:YqjF family protein [Lacipirellula limnantheis]|uniref:DUF2071 domain-containing protein n=1 Tax=Lacipirellula limnantheis TaxID=2528024 RepID=A0A517U594_9BACT|nr:DUF2071 domain-containing protein [Lacipirellula limnantheis]QDT75792.1 hypothetical protein I41_50350 [Lacipirellula limnantheis]
MISAGETIDANRPFTWPARRALLTAEWRHLAMLNFAVDRSVMAPLVPAGTELDDLNGESYASVIGFQFLRTTFYGVPIPLHRNFVEVNLRFYIRRRGPEGWRRGVAFVRELAPKRAVALVANRLYGERYLAVPMTHQLEPGSDGVPRQLTYGWRYRDGSGRISLEPAGEALPLAEGSHEHYIAEHYWGYSNHARGALEYQVAHPSWRYSPARSASFACDHVAAIYGEAWREALSGEPRSAFWADGSAVRVYAGRRVC